MKDLTSVTSVSCRLRSRQYNCSLTFAGVVVFLLLCLSGCGNQTVIGHVSWAQYYTSFKDLKLHSDFAVSGTITQIGTAVKPADGSFPYSDVTLSVKSVLWNAHPQKTVPPTLLFHENGGKAQDGTTYVIEDDPLYQVGQQVILFFTEYSPGQYRVTGGPTGRFVTESKQVKPIVPNGVQLSSGMNENGFENTLKTAN